MDDKRLKEACKALPPELRLPIMKCESKLKDSCREITLRLDRPIAIETGSKRYYLTDGELSEQAQTGSLTADKELMREFFENICDYSVYSRQNEINNGYITIAGGHRVGICGEAVLSGGKITNIKHITVMNLRIAREVKGCANELLSRCDLSGGLLLCGAPASGKTTLIRDLGRQLSYKKRVSMIDERNELSATVLGVSQNDIGMCDVYVGYPKSTGIMQAVRSMAPDHILCDEIGDEDDEDAVLYSANHGCSMIATMHAESLESLSRRPVFERLIKSGAFSTVVFLQSKEHVGEISKIVRVDQLCRS